MSELHRIEALETRVTYLEREQDGEKLVTRHILEQTRHNGDDLAAVRTRVDRLERKFDAFVAEFPKIVADSVREVLREERG